LAKNESRTFTYQARVATGVPYGTMSRQISWFGYDKHALQFDRVAAVPVNIPDWHTSHLTVDPAVLVQGEVFTYTLYLTNTGVADAPVVTVTTKIPAQIEPIESSINQSNLTYGPGEYQDDQIVWVTAVPRNQGVRLTYSAKLVTLPVPYYLPTRFTVDDGFIVNHRWTLNTKVQTYDVYFPLLTK
jgi:uncharacterized repeat protein (TIGR01451 family)